MMSNIELLKIELEKRKQGSIQQTINEIAVEFNRNKKNVFADFKVLGQTGFIEIGIGTWKYKAKELEAIINEHADDLLNDRANDKCKAKKANTMWINEIKRERLKVIKEIISELQKEMGAAPIEDIISKAEESGIEKETVEDLIQNLKSAGNIIESSNERFRTV